jgi:hypothetical protein
MEEKLFRMRRGRPGVDRLLVVEHRQHHLFLAQAQIQ